MMAATIRTTADEDEQRYQPGTFISQLHSRCSIVLNNVFKTENYKTILNGLNFIAFNGQICVILGEMKSGKSMLLSCLVGSNEIDKGQIWVLGGKPKTKSSKTLTKYVGYMPQTFCLYEYNEMTVKELLEYFGQLYVINYKFMQWRMTYYSNMFTLPPMGAIIKDLSFNEKRMVSFIIAVFHRPRLVVLDEPTVGLDILKRNQIWKYLNYINTTWKPTIIVATNNIQEAFSANKLAYLRNGKILFHEEVDDLHRMYANKSQGFIIEDLYINIMLNLRVNVSLSINQSEIPHDKKIRFYKQIIKLRSRVWKLKSIIVQNISFITKNIWIFILVCVFPTLQIIMHCINFGVYPNAIPIAVYNLETSCIDNPCNDIIVHNCYYFSCHFLNLLTINKITVQFYNSENEAKDSVVKGSTIGYMKVSKHYTKALINSLTSRSLKNRDDLMLNNSIIIEIHYSKMEFGKYLKKNLLNAQKEHLINVYKHYNLSTKYAEIPYKLIELENLGLSENSSIGIIACAVFISTMLYSALLIQSEIQNGYLMRNVVAGVTFFEIILSFLAVNITLSIIQSLFFILIVDFIQFMSWQCSLLLIIALNIIIGINGMSIGLFIGSYVTSSYQVLQVSFMLYFLNLIMCGLFWPLSCMQFLQRIALILPLSLPIEATKTILIHGQLFRIENIYYALISITCWTLISLTAFMFNIKNKINFTI